MLRRHEIRFEEDKSAHTKGSLASSEGCGIRVIPVVEYFIGVGAESWLCACSLGLQAESMSSMYTVYLPKESWRLQRVWAFGNSLWERTTFWVWAEGIRRVGGEQPSGKAEVLDIQNGRWKH